MDSTNWSQQATKFKKRQRDRTAGVKDMGWIREKFREELRGR